MKTKQIKIQSEGLPSRPEQLSTAKKMKVKAYQTPDGSWTSEVDTGVMRSTQPGFASEQEALTDAGCRAAKLTEDNRLPIDREQRTKNRTLPTSKVLNTLLTKLPEVYRLAEVVGKWVWVQFKQTPAAEIRQQLSQLGFHWNSERQAWQHPCGQFRLGSVTDPHQKYASYFPADTQPV
jgi:hypothetical protein